MREAPDVILIGEIRDAETMEAAIAFSETGHLCLATLHSNNADQTIERILNFFPEGAHKERADEPRPEPARGDLAAAGDRHRRRRLPATEVLINTRTSATCCAAARCTRSSRRWKPRSRRAWRASTSACTGCTRPAGWNASARSTPPIRARAWR